MAGQPATTTCPRSDHNDSPAPEERRPTEPLKAEAHSQACGDQHALFAVLAKILQLPCQRGGDPVARLPFRIRQVPPLDQRGVWVPISRVECGQAQPLGG